MKLFSELTDPEVVTLLRHGALGIIPTDTLYGIVCSARNERAVERLYQTRPRDPNKACIVLVSSVEDIEDTSRWSRDDWNLVTKYWPGPVSIILPASSHTPKFVRRAEMTVAYRVPEKPSLRQLLHETGPLLAPSANPEELPPASTVEEARLYFEDRVDFYVDGGDLSNQSPSSLICQKDGVMQILRGNVGK